ncbi:MAG: NAD+ synthase [Planctomycetes bacterium HGW-Planctomycetes-1]|nr:MAG: NAD+ synthase [Planctomycetes bacterium HGW-Planctomycetes-1]
MSLRTGLAQINTTVGDFAGNTAKIKEMYRRAKEAKLDLLIFPELCICGYPPEDLLLKKHFLAENKKAIEQLAKDCPDITIMAGFAEPNDGGCFNSLAILANGKITKVYRKALLPNYGVFDEKRYFHSGTEPVVIKIKNLSVVCTICEDIWDLNWLKEFLAGVTEKNLIVNISASPFHAGKINENLDVLETCAKMFNCPLAYCNIIGGQDELVFDGRSMFIDSQGRLAACAKAFEEDLLIADIEANGQIKSDRAETKTDENEEIYKALVLGTKDYLAKNGFKKAIVGLSGGIDSSLTAAIAVDAIGKENVIGVTMPTKFNSAETISDAEKSAKNLGIEFHSIPIEPLLQGFNQELGEVSGWNEKGLAFENLQARIRGVILMSLSNQFGYIVLTTGNKSETAVGYSTLYGDTAGGFAVIKDVPKTIVYKLSEYVNKLHGREVIPQSVITRIPSAELRHNQKDSDALPEYDILDRILKAYIEEEKSLPQIIKQGFDAETVMKVIRMVDRNEYKRRLCPPGVKITPKAFGRDRRMPITNRYNQQIRQ